MTLADATNAYRDRWRGPQRLMDAAEADHPSVVVEPRCLRWVLMLNGYLTAGPFI
jgi:hypothetical protein